MRLTEISVGRPVATLMVFLGVCLLGLVALVMLPVDMFPEIEPPVVSILTTWPGASASDVEEQITRPIEKRVNGVANLDTLTSRSLDNLSVVSCRFEWGTDLDTATSDLRNRLEMVKRKLPRDAEAPILYKFSSATAPVMFMTVTATVSWPRLYRITDRIIADQLRRVPGMSAIMIYGGLRRRINIYFDMARLKAYGLSLEQINRVLAAQNIELPAGSVKQGGGEYFVRIPGRYRTIEEIANTIIAWKGPTAVRLRQVARVEDAYKPMDLRAWSERGQAVVLLLQKQSGKNTVEVARAVRARLEKIRRMLPGDVRVDIVVDNSENILNAVRNLRDTLIAGIVLVVIVTLVFLRRVVSGLIIAAAIPFSLIISFIFMYLMGYTINLISLMSLAVASGMVVDNAIVVLENITRHMERGVRPAMAAIHGAREMALAITASTLTTVIIFLPMIFLKGLVGVMFRQLAFVITATLGASLVVALSMVPTWASRLVSSSEPRAGAARRLYERSEQWLKALEEGYGRVLGWCLENTWAVGLIVGAAIFSAAAMIPHISTSFMPKVDSGDVSVDFRLEEGTPVEETAKVVERVIREVQQVVQPSEFRHLYAWCGQSDEGIGAALGFDEAPNAASIGFKLVDRTRRKRSAAEIAQAVRERIATIPGVGNLKVMAVDPVGAILSGTQGKPLVVELQGPDLATNEAVARSLAEKMRRIPGLVDVAISSKPPRPEVWVVLDRDKALASGLTTAQVARQVRNYLYGASATELTDAGTSYDIFTRFTPMDIRRLGLLPSIPVFTAAGTQVMLGDIARIRLRFGPVEIQRKNLERIVRVEADLKGVALGKAVGEVRKVLAGMDVPEGVSFSFGGEVEQQRKAFKDLGLLLGLGIVLTYMVMAALFGNLLDPLIIMFSVPVAFVGIIWAFRLTGTTLGVISFMGGIMLVGIVVNNAIVLVDYTKLLERRGMGLAQAVATAGAHRLRPVLMTTLTTFFGMLPMAVSSSTGAELWNPLGITMLGGLTISSLITLVLVPTVYYLLYRRKERAR